MSLCLDNSFIIRHNRLFCTNSPFFFTLFRLISRCLFHKSLLSSTNILREFSNILIFIQSHCCSGSAIKQMHTKSTNICCKLKLGYWIILHLGVLKLHVELWNCHQEWCHYRNWQPYYGWNTQLKVRNLVGFHWLLNKQVSKTDNPNNIWSISFSPAQAQREDGEI